MAPAHYLTLQHIGNHLQHALFVGNTMVCRLKVYIHRPDSFRDSFKPGTLVPMEKLKCLSIDSGDFIQEELAAFGAEFVELPNSLQKLSRVVFAVPYSSLTGKLQPLSICILESDEMVCHDIGMLHIDVVEVDHGAGGLVDCFAAGFVDCDYYSHGGRNVTARNRRHDLAWSNFDNFFETFTCKLGIFLHRFDKK